MEGFEQGWHYAGNEWIHATVLKAQTTKYGHKKDRAK
jgi:hypothetical protein